jgi:hypothetical protein
LILNPELQVFRLKTDTYEEVFRRRLHAIGIRATGRRPALLSLHFDCNSAPDSALFSGLGRNSAMQRGDRCRQHRDRGIRLRRKCPDMRTNGDRTPQSVASSFDRMDGKRLKTRGIPGGWGHVPENTDWLAEGGGFEPPIRV